MSYIFKPGASKIETSDFWYDLTDGGYIRPQDILCEPKQITRVNEALKVLLDFKRSLEQAGMVEYL